MSKKATVTLMRGRTYIYGDTQFFVNEPKVVDESLGQELENLVDEVTDSDGERRGKARFKVSYDKEEPRTIPTVRKKGTLQTIAKPAPKTLPNIKKRTA